MSAIKQIALTLYGQTVSGISIPIGSTVSWTLDIEDPDTREPVDLTAIGTAVQWSLAALDVRGNPIIPPLVSHQATIPGSPVNRCTVLQTSGDTVPSGVPFSPADYVLDVWLTDGSGNRLQTLGTATVKLAAVATLPGTPVTPAPPEQPLGEGPAGAPIVWRGVYDSGTSYAPLDAVSFDAADVTSSYVCTAPTTGHDPTNTSFWDLMASGQAGGGLPDPGSPGDVLVNRGGVWTVGPLTADDIQPGFSITSFAGAGQTLELGATVTHPAFTASYSSTPNSVSITDDADTQSVSLPATSFAYNGSGLPARTYTRTTLGSKSWTLSAVGAVTKTASVSDSWVPRAYYGEAVPGTLNSSFVTALATNVLEGSLARTISLASGDGSKKGYYWVPTALGAITTSKDANTGFAIPITAVASITVTNANSVAVPGTLYATDSFIVAAAAWQVS